MDFNPLDLPFNTPGQGETQEEDGMAPHLSDWGISSGVKPAQPSPVPVNAPPLNRQQEAELRADQADETFSVEVRGVKGKRNGTYRFAYQAGRTLGAYLDEVQLKYTGIKNAVYDLTNLEKGRLRMNYVPQPKAKIAIGSSRLGPRSHLQRSQVDAEAAARNMGGGARFVDVSLEYKSPEGKQEQRVGIDDLGDMEQL